MRNPWKMLIFRSFSRFPNQATRIQSVHHQVRNPNLPLKYHFLSSFLTEKSPFLPPGFGLKFQNPANRGFSSEPEALESKDLDHAPLIEIFSKAGNPDEIKAELESIDLSVDYETVLSVLRILDQDPETARRFFDWVSETDNGKLSSKSYNLMLRILGRKDYLKEFWDLVSTMKKKGYGISKITFEMVSDNFNKEGMLKDLDTLKEMYNTPRPMEDSLERVCSKVCKVIREDEWGESVKAKLEDLGTGLSNDLISTVLGRIEIYPSKALMFFRWGEENPSFKHNAKTYNSMASILAREDSIDDFWVIVNEMKDAGYEMEMPTYVKVSGRFFKRKMLKDAVDLYEYMLACSDKPPAQDCMFLLRKIVVGENPDMDLFSRVMRVFTDRGNVLTRTIFDGVLKSLTGAGKLGECDKILKAMEDGGFVANSAVYSQVVLGLCKAGKLDEACEFLEEREAAGHDPGLKAWASLIQGFCAAGEIDKAASRFRKMVERKGAVDAGGAFEVLVNGFCLKNREADACKLLIEMVNRNQLRPWHVTYKMLVEKLLAQKSPKEALSLLGLMKSHGFPPYIDPFISYISKSGSGDDAVSFLKAMSVKRFPSTSVFVRMFEEFFKAGRHDAAHDFLSKSPGYIRGHADVLNLFFSMKTEEAATAASVA